MENSGKSKEIGRLIAMLGDQDIERRREAVKALAALKEAAIDALIRALATSDNNDTRWYEANALRLIGEPVIDPLIGEMRNNTKPEFRRYGAAVLGALGAPAVGPLIEAMRDSEPELRGFIALALCRIGEPAVDCLTRGRTRGRHAEAIDHGVEARLKQLQQGFARDAARFERLREVPTELPLP